MQKKQSILVAGAYYNPLHNSPKMVMNFLLMMSVKCSKTKLILNHQKTSQIDPKEKLNGFPLNK
jgi:hypothetical protein